MPSPSFIGVAIACGGNVLISLALTVQKLAHRRQSDELSQSSSPSSSSSPTPGNQPSQPLSPVPESPVPESHESPIIPILVVPSTPRRSSTSSETTVRLLEPGIYIPPNSQPHSVDLGDTDSIGEGEKSVEEGAYLKSKLWWLGLGLMCIGEGGNFLSYGFAPASVVAPLGTVALIANCAFAPLILGEKFKLRDLVGVGLAITGAVTVVWASNDTNPRLGPSGLIKAISQPIFIGYTITTCVLLVVLMFLSRLPRWGGHYIGIDVGICALFGGYTVLSTKALSSLLSRMFLRAFEYKITWVLVAVLVGTSICQIKYLNKALMRFESKEVIPTQFVFFSLAAIIGSAVLYQEFRDVAPSRLINFIFGIATTFLGVHLLTSSFNRNPSPSTSPSPQNAALSIHRPSLSLDETTPLIIHSPLSPSLVALSRTTSPQYTLLASDQSKPTRIKLARQTSTGNITTSLGNSQGGFLLLATTPPPPGVAGGWGSGGAERGVRRERSRSRGGDEERGKTGRRSSLAPPV